MSTMREPIEVCLQALHLTSDLLLSGSGSILAGLQVSSRCSDAEHLILFTVTVHLLL